MRNHKFRLVTAILLLLLIAAIANTYIIFQMHDGATDSAVMPRTSFGVSGHAPSAGTSFATAPPKEFIAFSWYGDATLTRLKDGRYELEAQAYKRGSRFPFQIDSIAVDIRRPGSDDGFKPKLEPASAGKFTGRIEFPSAGTWEIRVRMHQGVQTLEFTKKFTTE